MPPRFWFRRHKNTLGDVGMDELLFSVSTKLRFFPVDQLKKATNNFSENRLINQRAFGSAFYKGMLHNGTIVVVKRMKIVTATMDIDRERVLNEMSCAGMIRHRNINRLIGYSRDGKNGMLLVWEFAANGNLYDLLHDPSPEILLNWHMRVGICIGIARGLSYLHEDAIPHVIHRDISSRNILLDNNFVPKISDFGDALFFSDYDELPLDECVVGRIGYC